MKTLAIDAVNIQGGGGLTHLVELLNHAEPEEHGFEKVLVFGGSSLDRLENKPWLVKHYISNCRVTPLEQFFWNQRSCKKAFESVDLVFSPAATFSDPHIPYVALPQNMLVFDSNESGRFPLGWTRARYRILRFLQIKSLSKSVGNIFLSHYAKEKITKFLPKSDSQLTKIIHHGVNPRFTCGKADLYTNANPEVKFLYVSTVNFYKHQWNVVEAIAKLRKAGINAKLKLIGGGHPKAIRQLQTSMKGRESFVSYTGAQDYHSIHTEYAQADIFVFASSCENMPNILIEAMAAGLPIACSNYPPMPEFMGDLGFYFDPTSSESIFNSLLKIAGPGFPWQDNQDKIRSKVKAFTWKNCADETFQFFKSCSEI